MGKYDIDAQFMNEANPTLNDLCKEILKETGGQYSDSELLFKFKNKQGSGLINKLKKYLNFDAEKMSRVSSKEKFDEMKLLKELFYIEKDGLPKYVNDYNPTANSKVRIINILAKPRLSNIESYYSESSVYGKIFKNLFSNIKSNVPDAEKRIDIIEDIEAYWQLISQQHFDYVNSNMALADMESSLKNLQRINRTLKTILDKLDFDYRNLHMSTEGIMNTFFNILLVHRRLCYETDRIKVTQFIDIDFQPNTEYIELFRKYEYETLKTSKASMFKKALEWGKKPEEINNVFNLISYCKEIPKEEYRHYKYAFDHVHIVLDMMSKEKLTDYSEEVYLALFVSVVQEIVYVKKNSDKLVIRNDYYGYNPNGTTLLSALKNPENEVDAILVHIWIRRVETRFSINYGAHALITEKNKTELLLFQIKEFIYGYRNLNELKIANEYLIHMVRIASTHNQYVDDGRYFFELWLEQHLKRYGIKISQFVLLDHPCDIYDLFREFIFAYKYEVNTYLNTLAEQVADTINKYGPYDITHKFSIIEKDGTCRKCYFDYKCDIIDKKFIYKGFGFIYSDEEKDNIKKLGLKNILL